jgi:hypothetical protein
MSTREIRVYKRLPGSTRVDKGISFDSFIIIGYSVGDNKGVSGNKREYLDLKISSLPYPFPSFLLIPSLSLATILAKD